MGRVQDRVAIVTGAANGLGQAIAGCLAQEGARVVLLLASDEASYITGHTLEVTEGR